MDHHGAVSYTMITDAASLADFRLSNWIQMMGILFLCRSMRTSI